MLKTLESSEKMENSDEYIRISHIEQYSYCPKQAKNNIDGLNFTNDSMDIGGGVHIKKDIREKFKKSVFQNTIKGDNKVVVQKILSDVINNNKSVRLSEVFVKSDELKILGKVDEIRIDEGNVSLIEYKTTFSSEDSNYHPGSAINQLFAYAIAFKEFYSLNCKLNLIVRRVLLHYDDYLELDKIKSHDELGKFNSEGVMLTSYWDATLSKNVYQTSFQDNSHLNETKETIKKIHSKDFNHEDNINKCNSCQYKSVCEDSLVINQ